MKPSALLLSLSLLANLAFIGALISTSSPAHPTNKNPGTSPQHAVRNEPTAASMTSASSKNTWDRLYSDDTAQFHAHLKSAGFSHQEIRAIILTRAQKQYEALRERVLGPVNLSTYWSAQAVPYHTPDDAGKRAKLEELGAEHWKRYEKYSADFEMLAEDEDAQQRTHNRFGNLPLEKLLSLAQIEKDYHQLEREAVQLTPDGYPTEETLKHLALLNTEKERDFQQALSPEEYTEHLLRNSLTARRLALRFDLFRPSETEHRALFALHYSVDQPFFAKGITDEQTANAHAEAIKKLEPQIEAVLGPERYADYQQLTDWGGDEVASLLVRLDLPLRTAIKINTVRDDITQRAAALRADPQLSVSERSARLQSLAGEAKTKLTATLGGPRGLEAYADLKGDWLRALNTP